MVFRELEMALARLSPSLVASAKIKENFPFVFDAQRDSDFSTIVLNGFKVISYLTQIKFNLF